MHAFLDGFEVFGRERLLAQKFVEKSGVGGRADAELHVRKEFEYGGGKQVRGGMAEDLQRLGVFFGEDFEFSVMVERARQVHEFARRAIANARNERGAGEARRNFFGDVGGGRAARHLQYGAILERNVNTIHRVSAIPANGRSSTLTNGVKEGKTKATEREC